jgi:Ribosomal protein L16p/L10e
MPHIKHLRLDFISGITKFPKNHKQVFLRKKKYSNLSFLRIKNILLCIITTQNKLIIPKHLQCVYKKIKYDIKQATFKLQRLDCYSFIYPSIMLTKKPRDIRMGRGKGMPIGICAKMVQGMSFLFFSYFIPIMLFYLIKKIQIILPFKSNIIRPFTF